MKIFKQFGALIVSLAFLMTLAGCAPEVGSEAWCNEMKEKPKPDWTVNEAADFTKHCIFK
jgi:hypothetical protein